LHVTKYYIFIQTTKTVCHNTVLKRYCLSMSDQGGCSKTL